MENGKPPSQMKNSRLLIVNEWIYTESKNKLAFCTSPLAQPIIIWLKSSNINEMTTNHLYLICDDTQTEQQIIQYDRRFLVAFRTNFVACHDFSHANKLRNRYLNFCAFVALPIYLRLRLCPKSERLYKSDWVQWIIYKLCVQLKIVFINQLSHSIKRFITTTPHTSRFLSFFIRCLTLSFHRTPNDAMKWSVKQMVNRLIGLGFVHLHEFVFDYWLLAVQMCENVEYHFTDSHKFHGKYYDATFSCMDIYPHAYWIGIPIHPPPTSTSFSDTIHDKTCKWQPPKYWWIFIFMLGMVVNSSQIFVCS